MPLRNVDIPLQSTITCTRSSGPDHQSICLPLNIGSTRTVQKTLRPTVVACIFLVAVTYL
jgi:hypothetical protein